MRGTSPIPDNGPSRDPTPAPPEQLGDPTSFPAPAPAELGNLACPPRLTIAVSTSATIQSNEADRSEKVPVGTWIGRALRSTAGSTEVLSSIGNSLISSELWSGIVLHSLAGMYAAWNQFRTDYLPARKKENSASNTRSGLLSELGDIAKSPGVYRWALSVAFVVNAVEAAVKGSYLLAVPLGLCAIANSALARILNEDYWRARAHERESSLLRKIVDRVWGVVPPRLQTILANPVPFWCAADMLFGVMNLTWSQMSSPLAAVPMGIAMLSCAATLMPALTSGKFVKPGATGFALSGVTNLSLGFANFVFGNSSFGAALTLWAVTSFIFAARTHRKNREAEVASSRS